MAIIEISEESKKTLKNCYVITTDHCLDEENIKLKKAITEILDKTMTSREKSLWNYEYFLKHHQYKDNLEYNINLLKKWSDILKESGSANFDYAYAIDRVVREVEVNNENI